MENTVLVSVENDQNPPRNHHRGGIVFGQPTRLLAILIKLPFYILDKWKNGNQFSLNLRVSII